MPIAHRRAQRSLRLLPLVVAFVLAVPPLAWPSAVAAAPTVTITDLGPGEATAINNAGQIVINTVVDQASELTHAFVWNAGQRTNLGTLGGSTYGYAINDAGQVAGASVAADGELHAFVWRSGTLTDIAPPDATSSTAQDINSRGHVVGSFTSGPRRPDGSRQRRAFVWNNGNLTALNPLAGDRDSDATAINARGAIVGMSSSRSATRLARWIDGVPSNVGQFNAQLATDINEYGVIAGMFEASRIGAFTWDNGAFLQLAAPDPTSSSRANAINSYGQAVGSDRAPAVLWQGQTLVELGVLGGYSAANDINDRGQIVGTSNGRALLWTITPTLPEPGPNLNASFEEDANLDGRADSWTVSPYASLTTTGEYSGLVGLRLKASGNRDFRVYQAVYGIRAGTTYDVRGVVNIPPTSDAFEFALAVSWKDAADQEIRLDTIKTWNRRTNGWTDGAGVLVAPPGTSHAVVRLQAKSLSATIYVDDVYFQPR